MKRAILAASLVAVLLYGGAEARQSFQTASGSSSVSVNGSTVADPDFRNEGGVDFIACTGAGAPDARCLADGDVIADAAGADPTLGAEDDIQLSDGAGGHKEGPAIGTLATDAEVAARYVPYDVTTSDAFGTVVATAVAGGGGVIRVQAGTHDISAVHAGGSLAITAPIRIECEEGAILDGENVADPMVDLFDVSAPFALIGCKVYRWQGNIVQLVGASVSDIVIRDNEFESIGRSAVAVQAVLTDEGAAATQDLRRIWVDGNYLHTSRAALVTLWANAYRDVWVRKNKILTITNQNSAIYLGDNELANQATQRDVWIQDNSIEDWTSNQAESHGILVYGSHFTITGNKIRDIKKGTGAGTGCEGLYTKVSNSYIAHNHLIEAGCPEGQAFFAMKGRNRNEAGTSPLSFNNVIHANVIEGTGTDPTGTIAMLIKGDEQLITSNVIRNVGRAIYGSGTGHVYRDNTITQAYFTPVVAFNGMGSVRWEGGYFGPGAETDPIGTSQRLILIQPNNLNDPPEISRGFTVSGVTFDVPTNTGTNWAIEIQAQANATNFGDIVISDNHFRSEGATGAINVTSAGSPEWADKITIIDNTVSGTFSVFTASYANLVTRTEPPVLLRNNLGRTASNMALTTGTTTPSVEVYDADAIYTISNGSAQAIDNFANSHGAGMTIRVRGDGNSVACDISDGTTSGCTGARNFRMLTARDTLLQTGVTYTFHDDGTDWWEVGSRPLAIHSTNPPVTRDGEIAQDTTADQFLYGAGPNVLHPVQQECAVIENLAAADDSFEVWMTAFPVTVTSVGCRCQGTCTTPATFTLEDRGGNAMTITGTNPTCATTGSSTYAAVTAGNALVAGEGMAFDVTNSVDPETDKYTLCWTYTVDRQ